MSRKEQSGHNQPGHNQIEQLLAIYPELAGAEQRLVDRHVQECMACASTQAAYKRMDKELMTFLQRINYSRSTGRL